MKKQSFFVPDELPFDAEPQALYLPLEQPLSSDEMPDEPEEQEKGGRVIIINIA